MIFIVGIDREKQKLAGLEARLAANRAIAELCAKKVPGQIVYALIELPQKIAELKYAIAKATGTTP